MEEDEGFLHKESSCHVIESVKFLGLSLTGKIKKYVMTILLIAGGEELSYNNKGWSGADAAKDHKLLMFKFQIKLK